MGKASLLRVSFILLAAASILFGGLWWQERARVTAYRDAAVCWGVVRAGGEAFKDVNVGVTSHPRAAVVGMVRSDADRQWLRAQLAEEFGKEQVARVAVLVRVEGEAILRTDPPEGVGGR